MILMLMKNDDLLFLYVCSCNAMQYNVMLCNVMQCYIMLCNVM